MLRNPPGERTSPLRMVLGSRIGTLVKSGFQVVVGRLVRGEQTL